MKTRRSLIALCFALGLASHILASEPLTIIARPHPGPLLPGLPFLITLDVSNGGAQVAELPIFYAIEVIPDRSTPFLVELNGRSYYDLPSHYLSDLTIEAARTRQFQLPLGRLPAKGFFVGDPRTWNPGTYRVRFIFSRDLPRRTLSVETIEADLPERETSNLLELVVEEPRGLEANTWKSILDATKGKGFGVDIGKALQTLTAIYPGMDASDRYLPYVGPAALPPEPALQYDFLSTLLAKIPPDHLRAEGIRLTLADLRLRNAIQAAESGIPSSSPSVEEALKEVDSFASSSPYDAVRAGARTALEGHESHAVVEKLRQRSPTN